MLCGAGVDVVGGCGRKLADCTKVVYVLVIEEYRMAPSLEVDQVVTHPIEKVGWERCGPASKSKHFVPFCEECAIMRGLIW